MSLLDVAASYSTDIGIVTILNITLHFQPTVLFTVSIKLSTAVWYSLELRFLVDTQHHVVSVCPLSFSFSDYY